MKNLHLLAFTTILLIFTSCVREKSAQPVQEIQKSEWVIVIHGGAGNLNPEDFTAEKDKPYLDKLTEALETGAKILESDGSSLDAVVATINILEDSPLFNAGKGAVFNADGVNELDASIMDGKTLNAGAVAGVTTIKNPINAARLVMEKSGHVMLIKDGAEKFALENGLQMVDPSYFFTEKRWKNLQEAKQREQKKLEDQTKKGGTVGCAALDKMGNLAAGTSTGGMTNKKYGRVGDSPIIGAGTYANNQSCAVSATGHGEYFIRNVVAYDISARILYRNETLEYAADQVIKRLKSQGGNGGVIALDKDGNIAMPFNTTGMFRGFYKAGGKPEVHIFN
jgi:beta-aspartyl-peptidase (threonine type)